jgi:hypothetical protein
VAETPVGSDGKCMHAVPSSPSHFQHVRAGWLGGSCRVALALRHRTPRQSMSSACTSSPCRPVSRSPRQLGSCLSLPCAVLPCLATHTCGAKRERAGGGGGGRGYGRSWSTSSRSVVAVVVIVIVFFLFGRGSQFVVGLVNLDRGSAGGPRQLEPEAGLQRVTRGSP